MPDFSDTTTIGILTAVGVVLAAIAAVTGIISVGQGARNWRVASRPQLEMFVNRNPQSGIVMIICMNTGGAPARGTTFLLVLGSYLVRGTIGPMQAGRTTVLETGVAIPDFGDRTGGLLSCYENGTVQAYFLTHERRRYHPRPWRKSLPNDDEMFKQVYPHLSLDGLHEVGWHVPMLTQP